LQFLNDNIIYYEVVPLRVVKTFNITTWIFLMFSLQIFQERKHTLRLNKNKKHTRLTSFNSVFYYSIYNVYNIMCKIVYTSGLRNQKWPLDHIIQILMIPPTGNLCMTQLKYRLKLSFWININFIYHFHYNLVDF
jgi:hypothetical protein